VADEAVERGHHSDNHARLGGRDSPSFPAEVDHFVECILSKKKTIVDLDDAIKTFEIIEAADRSASAGGKPVSLPLGW
jgi:predicted dehydrogenase